MKALVVVILLAGCGGQVSEPAPAPGDAFVEAVCRHASCPGWPEKQVCEYSYHAAMANLGAQDEACIADATAVVAQDGCGPEVLAVADGIVGGKCAR